MNRRRFLQGGSLLAGGLLLTDAGLAKAQEERAGWRSFEVTTHVEVLPRSGATRIWVPAALTENTPFQRTILNMFSAPGGEAELIRSHSDGLGIVSARFAEGVPPVLTVRSQVATRNYAADLSQAAGIAGAPRTELDHYRRATKMLPTDGLVKARADEITHGAETDLEKARALYEWVVENSYRDPAARGCGIGDAGALLESGRFGGKCADLNGLYVALARAAGLAARDAYGIRVAKSQLGYTSLGPSSGDVTKAQHCRAEVYVREYGWIPVDPADVRKVSLEEPPGHRPLHDDKVSAARKRLFGEWEMNWMAYNFAQDVSLPGSKGPTLLFLMYPQAETSEGRLDSLDPTTFRYTITAQEL